MRKTLQLSAAFLLASHTVLASAGIEEDVQQLLAAGNHQAALQQAELGLQQNAGNRRLLFAKGYALVKLNRLDEAASYYEQLRRVVTDDPEPSNNLAMVYRMQKKYPQAVTVFAETIRAFPAYMQAYENLGDTYIELARNQYQQGFATTGNTRLQTKATLSGDFNRLAAQASARQAQAAPQAVPAATQQTMVTPTRAVPAAKPIDPAQVRQTIVQKLSAWADAWMSRDSDQYFTHYSQQFTPGGGRSLDEWMQRKQNALGTAEYIKIYLTDIEIDYAPESPGVAAVEFNQAYESNTFQGRTRKRLDLKNSQNGWLIVSESNVN